MNLFDELWKIVATGLLIPAVGFVGGYLIRSLWTSKATVVIRIPTGLASAFRFGLLHVADGHDEKPVNKERAFKPLGRQGHLVATWRYRRRIGCALKCFVDHPGHDFEKIEKMLQESGYIEVRTASGKAARAYFIISDFEVVGYYRNNFYHPS